MMFLRLKEKFRPIAYDDFFELFDNNTTNEYLLDEKQYQLLLLLDGSKTEQEIMYEYDEKSRDVLKELLKELEQLGALEKLSSLQIRVFPKNYPIPYLEAMLWDITSLCNLECAHCYVSKYSSQSKGNNLSIDEVYQLIDETSSMNVRDISLTGGEPLMRKEIRNILKRVVDSNIHLASIFTNGIAVDQDFVDFLKSIVPTPKNFWVRHSLDGMTPKSNAVLRGDKMDPVRLFQKMTDSIRMFVEADISVSVSTGIHRFNVHDITDMYSFMKGLGVRQWRMAVPKPLGRFQMNQRKIGANWSDILEAYHRLIDLHLSEVRMVNGEIIAPISIGIEQVFRTELIGRPMNVFQRGDFACFYHKNRCSIKSNGDVVPCGYFDEMVTGNVRNGGLKQAWENPEMQKIKHICISEVTECRNCLLLDQCGTGCRAVAKMTNGAITAKDPYACYQAPFLKEVVLPLFKKYDFSLKTSEKCSEFSVMEQEVI